VGWNRCGGWSCDPAALLKAASSGLTIFRYSSARAQRGFKVEVWFGHPIIRRMHWRKVALIGVGLLGGSLGLDLKRLQLAGHVTGFVRRPSSQRDCLKFKVVDHATLKLEEAVSGAGLIILCTPLSQMPGLAESFKPWLEPGAVVTDVGSVKGEVVREMERILSGSRGHFVGSHPMAGGELMGVAAAREKLFEGSICVVTPTASTDADALRAVATLWESVGGRVKSLPPDLHDAYVARTSHLPHVAAAALANYVLSPAHNEEQATLCASGFRDTTRVASGSPEMWRDIALANREHLLRTLGVFIEDLSAFREAVEAGNSPGLHEFFAQAKKRRDQWIEASASKSPDDAAKV